MEQQQQQQQQQHKREESFEEERMEMLSREFERFFSVCDGKWALMVHIETRMKKGREEGEEEEGCFPSF